MIDPNKKGEKLKALDSAFLQIEKEHGKGAIMMGNVRIEVPILCSTGSIKLDTALGVGGIPEGRISEIYGPESSGKTTMTLIQIANVQRMGGVAAVVDAEHALDPVWATRNGVNMQELILSQPSSGDEALNIVASLVESGSVDLIVVDSVAALVPKAELEGDIGDSHMGLQARLMSQAMRILTGKVAKSHCHVIFINQIRNKIGVMFGSPETTTGGNALKFYATIRLDVRKFEVEKDEAGVEGQTAVKMKVKVVKNKVATPFKLVELDLNTGKNGQYGFDEYAEVLDLSVAEGLVKKAGTWYSYNDERVGQGKDNAIKFFRENLEFYKGIKEKTIQSILAKNESVLGSFNDVTATIAAEEPTKKRRGRPAKEEGNFEETALDAEPVAESKEAVS